MLPLLRICQLSSSSNITSLDTKSHNKQLQHDHTGRLHQPVLKKPLFSPSNLPGQPSWSSFPYLKQTVRGTTQSALPCRSHQAELGHQQVLQFLHFPLPVVCLHWVNGVNLGDIRQLIVNSSLLIGHLIGCTLFHALFRHPIGLN